MEELSVQLCYIPDDDKIPITEFPLVNPYTIFSKPSNSIARYVKQIFGPKHSKLPVKVFTQALELINSRFQARSQEHLVILSLPDDLAQIAIFQGYTHFGARMPCSHLPCMDEKAFLQFRGLPFWIHDFVSTSMLVFGTV